MEKKLVKKVDFISIIIYTKTMIQPNLHFKRERFSIEDDK